MAIGYNENVLEWYSAVFFSAMELLPALRFYFYLTKAEGSIR